MKFQPFAFYLAAVVFGILTASLSNLSLDTWRWLCTVFLVVFIIFFFSSNAIRLVPIAGLLLLLSISGERYLNINTSDYKDVNFEQKFYHLRIKSVLKPSEKYSKYLAEFQLKDSIQHNSKMYKTILYSKKNQVLLLPNDKVWIHSKPSIISKPKNPHQFNYAEFMSRKGVLFQVFTDTLFHSSPPSSFTINRFITQFKSESKQNLQYLGYTKEARMFIQALAMGDRTEVDYTWRKKLSAAGIMHLFAISGLHIGIVFALFMLVGYFLLFLRYGFYLRIIFALSCTWLFSLYVGFTPSVTRAAFMLTFYYTTRLLQRPTNLFHTLAVTAFILLLLNPNQLFDVGFQLSYCAVFFIAYLTPLILKNLPKTRSKIRYFYQLLSVTLAAQLGVLPLSLHYFNQASGLFLLGNLLLLPFAGLLIVVSVLSLIFSTWFPTWHFWVRSVNFLFDVISSIIDWLSNQTPFLVQHISFSWLEVFLSFAFLISIKYTFSAFKMKKLIPILIIFFLLELNILYQEFRVKQKQELIVFNQYKENIIGIRKAKQLDVFWNVKDSNKTFEYLIKPFIIKENIKSYRIFPIHKTVSNSEYIKTQNFIDFNHQIFFIPPSFQLDSIPKVDYFILQHSYKNPKIYSQKKVIADASNYPNYITILKDSLGPKLWYTQQNGAYIHSVKSP